MDRLLTDEDMRNIEAKVFRESQPNGEYFERDVKRAIRDKTAHLVATQIFEELEEEFGLFDDGKNGLELSMIVIKPGDYYSTEDALERYWAFKSKFLGGENG